MAACAARTHGSAFASFVETRREGFQLLSGAATVRVYASSPGVEWHFCAGCGAKLLFVMHAQRDLLWVAAGALDDALERRPAYPLFVASKAPWFTIHDNLPQHATYPAAVLNAQA